LNPPLDRLDGLVKEVGYVSLLVLVGRDRNINNGEVGASVGRDVGPVAQVIAPVMLAHHGVRIRVTTTIVVRVPLAAGLNEGVVNS
jgi:hypothetical protein